ncbi:MAG: tRNA threonylcarbamoyladenosine dehydratase [Lachnospiraceae bacterium]|nr:tRNA threonylcarbamoyladenosine dehydratase [Lachnospiraceae bacterium]
MSEQFSRTELLLGDAVMQRLAAARVAVFGIGGVGGHTVEALVRSGVGAIDIIDDDKVCLSNLNRQLIATHRTIGMDKVDAMQERIREINPECKVTAHKCFYLPETKHQFDFTQYDYVVDAVDTVTAKIELVLQAQEAGVPIISSMGAGNKLDPTAFEVTDIYKTSVCPLAKVMRRELKKRDVKKLKVVYSKELPIEPQSSERSVSDGQAEESLVSCEEAKNMQSRTVEEAGHAKRRTPGSTAFVPSVVGLIIAAEVIKDLARLEK